MSDDLVSMNTSTGCRKNHVPSGVKDCIGTDHAKEQSVLFLFPVQGLSGRQDLVERVFPIALSGHRICGY